MNKRLLGLAGTAILALAATPALAQRFPAMSPPGVTTAALVGQWLHDSRGGIIGSVKSVSPDGRTATILLGVLTLDNVRQVEVPVSALSVAGGKVTLTGDTAEARNATPLR